MALPDKFNRRKLRELRESRGWSLYRLARLTGLSPGFLSHIEHGYSNPSVETLERLARAFGVPVSAFFETETRRPEPVSFDEALEELLSRADVMFDGLPVGELDEEVRRDLRAAVRAVLEYEMRRRGREAGPPKGRAAAAAGAKADAFLLAGSA